MKKKTLVAICFLLTVCSTTKLHSQGNVSIHLGPSLPVSDFASDDGPTGAAAAIGLNIGVQYRYPFRENGFGLFGGLDLHYNGLKKSAKDATENVLKILDLKEADIKYPKYINIPLTAGLDYTFQVDYSVALFAQGGLAVNFLKATDLVIGANDLEFRSKTDLATGIGFKVGGGVLIKDRFSISIDYLGLGKHDIDGSVQGHGVSQKIDGEQKVTMLALALGVKF